jgi:hypothetical protein
LPAFNTKRPAAAPVRALNISNISLFWGVVDVLAAAAAADADVLDEDEDRAERVRDDVELRELEILVTLLRLADFRLD